MRSFLNKQHIIAFSLTTMVLTLATSCSDKLYTEDNQFDESDKITFTADLSQDWYQTKDDPKTRAVDEEANQAKPIRIEYSSGQELYLHPNIVNGISEAEPKEVANTRSSQTTGKVIESNAGNTPTADFVFGVSAYLHAKSAAATSANFIANQSTSKSGSVYVPSDHNYYWPDDSKQLDFYAHYPTSGTGLTYTDGTAGVPTLHYEVPAAASSQMDIMEAKSLNQNKTSATYTQPLAFSHLMTCITFSIGDLTDDGTIESITLLGVKYSGDYNYNPTDETHPWSLGTGTKDFSITTNHAYSTTTKNITITSRGGANAFMMLPQTFESNSSAKIKIVYIDSKTVRHELTASLAGQDWLAGTTVDYKIRTSSIYWNYELSVVEPTAVAYNGGSTTYKVTSYKHSTSGKNPTPISWQVTGYSVDGGATFTSTKPSWLTIDTNGSGSTNTEQKTANLSSQSPITNTSHTSLLYNATPKGSASDPYDLSKHDIGGRVISQTTANCYIINSPGFYKIPLVYGNAIKNGQANPSAYSTSASSSTVKVLSKFVNHLDNAITSPYINDNAGCAPVDVCIVWQDANNLVQSDGAYKPTLIENNRYIRFYVSQDHITQGNAVIAVRDNDAKGNKRIMWSWHIWVTDENVDEYQIIKNHAGKSFKLFKLNLGRVSASSSFDIYPSRRAVVRIKQTGADEPAKALTATFEVRQNSHVADDHTQGVNLYYQWGRKDPMLAGNGIPLSSSVTSNNHAVYNAVYTCGGATISTTIGNAIQHPYLYYNYQGQGGLGCAWCTTAWENLWNSPNVSTATEGGSTTTKTIYDPSPIGYKVPPVDTFDGMLTTSGVINSPSSSVSNGTVFYCFPEKNTSGGTYYVPACGYRIRSQWSVVNVNNSSNFWTAGPSERNDHAYGAYIAATSAAVHSLAGRDDGASVRPIVDE